MKRMSWKVAVSVVLALVVLAGSAAYVLGVGGEDVGPRAPDVSVQLLDGRIMSLSQLEGQVVLINFWATWCPPCRLEMPGFQRVWEARRDDGFVIVGLTTDQLSDEQIRRFLEERGYEYPVGRATGYVANALGFGNTLPQSFLIDGEGRIRREVTGAYDEAELVRDVDGLLREAGREPTGEVEVVRPEPPRWLDLEGAGHAVGSPDAPITVVEFSDYGCMYCSRFTQESFPALHGEFIETGHVRWMHVPFVLGKFRNADEATVAAACAGEQSDEVFQAVHLTLFQRQAEWRESRDAAATFRGYVEAAGGDVDDFTTCYSNDQPREALARAERLAAASGVASTPTFFINGERVEGALPLEAFQRGFRAMLP